MEVRGRRILWSILALVVVLAVVLFVVSERLLKAWIENTVSSRTGRELTIGGFDIDWSLRPRVRATEVRFENADWAAAPEMASIAGLNLRLDLPALFSRKVVIYDLRLSQPQVWLERNAGGDGNWKFGDGDEEERGGEATLPELHRLSIDEGQVRFVEQQLDTDIQVAIAADPDAGRQQAVNVRGAGSYRGEPFELTAQGDSLLRLFEPDQGYRLQAAAAAADTSVRLEGEIFDPRALTASDLNLVMELAGPDPERLYRLTGLPLPSLPPYRIAGRVVRQGQKWTLSDFDGTVGDSDLHGNLSLALDGERPVLTAELTSEMLDLDDLGPLVGAAPETKPGETASPEQRQEAEARQEIDRILPQEEISIERVQVLDAAVQYSARRVKSGKLPVDALEVRFTLEGGRMAFSPLKLGVGKGSIDGQLHLDTTGEALEAKLNAELRRVDLVELLRAFEVADESFGTVAGKANLWMRGNSVAALLGSADGGLYLLMTGGQLDRLLVELAGLDAGEALMALMGDAPQSIPIECAFLDLQARGGVFSLDTAIIDSTDTLFLAGGAVDLGDEQIDVVLSPRPKDPSLFAARSELRIQGPLGDPGVRPGGETLLKGAAAAVLAAVAGPAAALLPLMETGGGEHSTICSGLVGSAEEAAGTQ